MSATDSLPPPAALLREVARRFIFAQKAELACRGGVSFTQCTLLTVLGRDGPKSAAELTRIVGVEKSWVSRTLEQMDAAGWISRQPHPTDRRAQVVMLTPAGTVEFQRVETQLNAHADRILDRLASAEREQAQRLLARLVELMSAAPELSADGGERSPT